jgi:hypothetical protein
MQQVSYCVSAERVWWRGGGVGFPVPINRLPYMSSVSLVAQYCSVSLLCVLGISSLETIYRFFNNFNEGPPPPRITYVLISYGQ